MNSGLNKSGSSPQPPPGDVWNKWLQATGVNGGYGYRVPEEVWNAAWNGNWPDDKETIQWILDEYLDLETAKACGYLELVVPLRQQAEAALNAAKSNAADQHRQLKIDADIDEIIGTIRGLGRESDEKSGAAENCGEKPSRKRDRGTRSTITTMIAVAVVALAGFVGGYNSRAAKHPADIAVAPSPEIRRAIPVEPEIRRAIPEPQIRKAIPMQAREPEVDRRSRSRALALGSSAPLAGRQHRSPRRLNRRPAATSYLLH
jgi:hypothetical protein